MKTDAFDFFGWFDRKVAVASKTPVGKRMLAAGYEVQHTGGGCLAWERRIDDKTYVWICDEGNGLGSKLREHYLLGLYVDGGNEWMQDEIFGLDAAIMWAHHAVLALTNTRKWVKRLGDSVTLDKPGKAYVIAFGTEAWSPQMSDDEVREYDADREALLIAPGDPNEYIRLAKAGVDHAQ